MLTQVHRFVLQGIGPLPCEVEVDVAKVGLVRTTSLGLHDATISSGSSELAVGFRLQSGS